MQNKKNAAIFATSLGIALAFLSMSARAQTVSLFAGTGAGTLGAGINPQGDGLRAVNATLNRPSGMVVRADGSLLIADQTNHRIRRVDASGVITTFAGRGTRGFTGSASDATMAMLADPSGIAEDQFGNVYIGNQGSLQKVSPSGALSTVAGTGMRGFGGDNQLASHASVLVNWPVNIKFDVNGNLFFADFNACVIRKIDTANVITTVAGVGTICGYVGEGLATATRLNNPIGLVIDTDGTITFADSTSRRIRKFIPGGSTTTIAGDGGLVISRGDGGPAFFANFYLPGGLEKDAAGNLYITDIDGNRVRQIKPDGNITTFMGPPTNVFSPSAPSNNNGDTGLASRANIWGPLGLAKDALGNLYVSSQIGHKVRKITFPVIVPPPSVFKSFANTVTAALGSISPEGEQTVPFGGIVKVAVTAKPRHVLRVASNCDYLKTSAPIAFVPNGTGTETYDVTVNGPCQMEATFTALNPKANVNTEMAANALFTATERSQVYAPPATIAQTTSIVGAPVKLKAWVTDIAGVPYPSATNVITFKANGIAIAGCINVPLTLRGSNVLHIREASCTTAFTPAGNVTITSEFGGDTYNFPAASGALNHSVVVQ